MKKILSLFLSAFLANHILCGTLPQQQLNEANLLKTLLDGYDPRVRPGDIITGKYIFYLKQIVSLDEKNQIMTSSSYFAQYWNDPRLTWDPNIFNLTRIKIPAKNIWLPDIAVINAADSDGYLNIPGSDLALVNPNGQVYITISAISLKTRCSMNVRKFPFDQQKCSIVLSSWAYSFDDVDFNISQDSVNKASFVTNSIWELTDIVVTSRVTNDRFAMLDANYTSEDVSFDFYLKRRPLFFMINAIFPCLILNLITILPYFMPFVSQAALSNKYFYFSLNLTLI